MVKIVLVCESFKNKGVFV